MVVESQLFVFMLMRDLCGTPASSLTRDSLERCY